MHTARHASISNHRWMRPRRSPAPIYSMDKYFSQLHELAAQQDNMKVPARRSSSAEVTYGSLVSALKPSDISDHGSAAGSIERPMAEDDETGDHTMNDVPAGEKVPAESEPVDLQRPDGEDSDEKKSDQEKPNKKKPDQKPLEAASRWPYDPSKKDIARLAECSGLDDNPSKGYILKLTTRDVVVNASASVQFLREVRNCNLIDPDDIGINSEGQLFMFDPARRRRDHRNEFCDVVRKLEEKSIYNDIREQMQTYLGNRDMEYFNYFEETKEFTPLIDSALKKKVIEIPKLKLVAAKCRKAVVALDKVVTLVNAVKQDLLDTGSTSFKRWNQLQSTGLHPYLLEHHANAVLGIPTPAIINKIVEDLTEDGSRWQALLGLTLTLLKDLELAIGDIPYDYRDAAREGDGKKRRSQGANA